MERGQEVLVEDLKKLLKEAEDGEFGEFSNKKYPTPKLTLADELYNLRMNVINGKYDAV